MRILDNVKKTTQKIFSNQNQYLDNLISDPNALANEFNRIQAHTHNLQEIRTLQNDLDRQRISYQNISSNSNSSEIDSLLAEESYKQCMRKFLKKEISIANEDLAFINSIKKRVDYLIQNPRGDYSIIPTQTISFLNEKAASITNYISNKQSDVDSLKVRLNQLTGILAETRLYHSMGISNTNIPQDSSVLPTYADALPPTYTDIYPNQQAVPPQNTSRRAINTNPAIEQNNPSPTRSNSQSSHQ
ncbi:MAG: hypothetical protein K6D38_05965 [Pseudobutyrivibrio sp.]|nr:hypothetical protein [Pseudobutyrivibrio sp.]